MANKVTLNNGNVLATADISAQGTVTGSTQVNAPASLTYKNKELSTYFSELDGKYLKLSSDTMQQVVGDMDVTGEMEADTVRVDSEIYYRENIIEDVFVSKNVDDGTQTMENSLVIAGGKDLDVTGSVTVGNGISAGGPVTVGTYVNVSGGSYCMPIQRMAAGELPTTFIPGYIYDLGELTSNVDLSSASFPVLDSAMTCEVWFKTGANAYTVTLPAGVWLGASESYLNPPMLNTNCRVVLRKEGTGNLIISVGYEYT